MRVTFAGTGDAFGSGGRFNTCFMVEADDARALIDCGASSLIALKGLGIDPNSIRTIFISHLHGDHFGGLPFFILDGQFGAVRSAPLTVTGPPGLERRLGEAMEVLFPRSSSAKRPFEVEIIELPARRPRGVNGFEIECFEVEHFSGAPSYAQRLRGGGRTFVYSGDTQMCEGLVAAAQGAHLLVCECYQYDKPVRFHLDYRTIAANRGALGAERIILTHMSPAMLDRLDALEIETAHDGLVIEL